MAQYINLNWNNRPVVAHRSTALGEKTDPIFLLLVGLTAGWQPKYGWIWKFFNSLHGENYSDFYFV